MRVPKLQLVRRLAGAVLTTGILLTAGCESGGRTGGVTGDIGRTYGIEVGEIEPPQSLAVVLDRVNRNAERMTFLLRGGGVKATGEYLEKGKLENYELRGTLLYRKPTDLFLELQHSVAGKMEVGSNTEEFWVWKRIGNERYWWGLHQDLRGQDAVDMPLRPDDLVDVLGLQPLRPPTGDRGFKVLSDRYELRYTERSPSGWQYVTRVVHVDRRPPYLVREITRHYPSGERRMIARIANYQPVAGSDVLAPRWIDITWPTDGGHMNLVIREMERYAHARAERKFVSPRARGRIDGHEMERVMPTPSPAALAP